MHITWVYGAWNHSASTTEVTSCIEHACLIFRANLAQRDERTKWNEKSMEKMNYSGMFYCANNEGTATDIVDAMNRSIIHIRG